MALRDTKGDGHFDMKESFGEGSSTGIGLRNGYLYVAKVNSVERYKMTPGQLKPTGPMEVVVSGLQGERQHGDKGLTFDGKGSLYVNVGAPSNACQTKDRQAKSPGQDPCPILEKHGGIWKFDENKLGQTQEDGVRFATGLRQMPAITWHDGALYIAMNNRDQLDDIWPGQFTAQENADRPSEPLYRAEQGSNFGWPFCFFDYGQKKFLTNPEYGGDGKTSDKCGSFTPPVAAFPAHWAPVDIMFYSGKEFPKKLSRRRVHSVSRLLESRTASRRRVQRDVPTVLGWQAVGHVRSIRQRLSGQDSADESERRRGAADGVAQAPDGSLYIGDSQKGRIWHVYYRGSNHLLRASEGRQGAVLPECPEAR